VVVGTSGAGMSTLLRMINRLVEPSAGRVLIDGRDTLSIPEDELRHSIGYVIQGYGLFPHRTVSQNIATVPRLLGWDERRIREAAADVMARVGLPFERFADRPPRSLSGGEQQRVGIARAIVANPSILLCDEPFGALDPIVRRELQDAFRALRADATIVFVTHDLAEALRVAERVVLFDDGQIVADTAACDFIAQDIPLVRQFVASATLPAGAA